MGGSENDINLKNKLVFVPLTIDNWDKFVQLFGKKGACCDCWCMYYRLPKVAWEAGKADNGNKNAMHRLVIENKPAGILAFYEDEAIAWAAFAPREDFIKLEKSRVHKRIDNKPVWSVPCFFIKKEFRRKGVTSKLIKGIIKYARESSIEIIEAYPSVPAGESPDAFLWTGLYKPFEQAGFKIVDQKSKNKPMVRYYTEPE